MNDLTRELMHKVYNRLTPEMADSIESQFENLNILWEQIYNEIRDRDRSPADHRHYPALELLAGEVSASIMQSILEGMMQYGPRFNVQGALYDVFVQAVLFGHRAGKLGWPFEEKHCNEVHD